MNGVSVLGQKYSNIVDRGEAYSYAAANLLRVPLLSNDAAALADLVDQKITIPTTVLRAFDILVFGLQIGVDTEDGCDEARKALVKLGEFVPACFQNASFQSGLPSFFARLADGSLTLVGSGRPFTRFDTRLWVLRMPGQQHLQL